MIAGTAPEPLPFTLPDGFIRLRSEHEGYWYPEFSMGEQATAGRASAR